MIKKDKNAIKMYVLMYIHGCYTGVTWVTRGCYAFSTPNNSKGRKDTIKNVCTNVYTWVLHGCYVGNTWVLPLFLHQIVVKEEKII